MTNTGNGLPAIHPGEFLAEIIAETGVSQAAFARAIGVSAMRVSHVVKGARPVTAELAHRLGCAFGQSPQYWMNLQVDYDLKITAKDIEPGLKAIRRFQGSEVR
jgi:addiction module HigA family antidote